ncbi:MAG: Crp/Fnr family transcriptional regulator [Acidimicrobiia bacterium]
MNRDARIALLRGVWLFERCSRAELALLAKTATPVQVRAGKVLAREGEFGREFFVILSGTMEASRNGVRVAALVAGDFFGEMALVDRQPRAATVTVLDHGEVLVLTRAEFVSVLTTMPSVDHKIIAVLARRLRDLEDRFMPQHDDIDLVSDDVASDTAAFGLTADRPGLRDQAGRRSVAQV